MSPDADLTAEDRREVLEVLLEDARQSTDDVARQTGLSEDAAAAAIEALEAEGVIRGYTAVVDWERIDDDRVSAQVELNVELDRETSYTDISRRIAKFPAVDSLRLVSGEYDFAVDVVGESMHDVSDFIAERIAPIPEVTQTVTHFVMTTYKDRGIDFDGEDEDDRLSVSP